MASDRFHCRRIWGKPWLPPPLQILMAVSCVLLACLARLPACSAYCAPTLNWAMYPPRTLPWQRPSSSRNRLWNHAHVRNIGRRRRIPDFYQICRWLLINVVGTKAPFHYLRSKMQILNIYAFLATAPPLFITYLVLNFTDVTDSNIYLPLYLGYAQVSIRSSLVSK